MNFTSLVPKLPQFNSTLSLSSKISDQFSTFVFPAICFLGMSLNSVSIYVLCKILSKNKTANTRNASASNNMFKYMLMNQIVDLISGIFSVFIALFRCGSYCSLGYNFYSKVYEQYIYLFIINSVLFWGFLIEIAFAFERLASFSAKTINNQENKFLSFKRKIFLLFIISLIANTPTYLISRSITPIGILVTNNYEILYTVASNSIGNSLYGKIFLFIWTMLRGFLLYIGLFILNLIIAYKFKKHLKSKINKTGRTEAKSTDNQSKIKERKVTKMLIIINMYYLIGNFPIKFIFVVSELFFY